MSLSRSWLNSLAQTGLRAFLPLASNFFSLVADRPDRLAPFYISWLLTYRCNRRCRHCDWVWSRTTQDYQAQELTSDQKLDLAKQISRSWTWGASISGGEPLLDPAVMDIVQILKRGHKHVNLCTNGVTLASLAKQLVDLRLDTVTVSMDSMHQEVHDSIRGVHGTFDRALRGLQAIKDARGNRGKPRIVVKSLISPLNYLELPEQVEFFGPVADRIEFQPVQDNLGHRVKDTDILFSPEMESMVRAAIRRLIHRWPQYDTPYYREMPDFLFHPDRMLMGKRFKCLFSSAFFLSIDPDGGASGCTGRFISGNVRRQTFLEIWRGAENFRKQRKMRADDYDCICWNYGRYPDQFLLPIYSFLRRGSSPKRPAGGKR